MEAAELKRKFTELFDYIINSDDECKMHVLGDVTKAMMMRTIETSQTQAEEYIGKLESVRWNNYVTFKEAEAITSKMQPKPMWTRTAWDSTMEKLGAQKEEVPFYNDNALYLTMCMISSDSGETIKDIISVHDDTSLFTAIHRLALDKLKDHDKVFNIRNYFGI